MSYERITVVGNIGSVTPVVSEGGRPYIRLTLAVNRGQGEYRKTVWYTVMLFGVMAREPEKFVTRYRVGRLVLVEGRPQTEAYLRKDGSPEVDNAIVATAMPELLDAPKQG